MVDKRARNAKRVLQLLESTTLVTALATGLLTAFAVGSASATPIPGLVQNLFPDITTEFIDLQYTPSGSGEGMFIAIGGAISFKSSDASPVPISGGMTLITAQLSSLGTVVDSGAITISGSIGGASSTDLLTGDLLQFGFDDAFGSPFGFVFEVSGGSLGAIYGGTGAIFTAFLSPGSINFSGFANGFDSFNDQGMPTGAGVANTGTPIPEPSSALLLGAGLLAMANAARRSKMSTSRE